MSLSKSGTAEQLFDAVSIANFLNNFGRGDWGNNSRNSASTVIQTRFLMKDYNLNYRTFTGRSNRVYSLLTNDSADLDAVNNLFLAAFSWYLLREKYRHFRSKSREARFFIRSAFKVSGRIKKSISEVNLGKPCHKIRTTFSITSLNRRSTLKGDCISYLSGGEIDLYPKTSMLGLCC